MSGHQHDEGHTIAGWAGCAIAVVGAAVTAVGIISWNPGIWLGLGVMVAAVVVTWVLHLAGWGKSPGPRPADQWGLRVRDQAARAGHVGCLGCRLAGRRGVTVRPVTTPEPTTATAARTDSPAGLSS